MSKNKKLLVITVSACLVTSFFGIILTEHFVNIVKAERWSAYSQGHIEGYNEGYDKGFCNGNLTGYQNGNSSGYNLGNKKGYDSGYDQGVSDGYQYGYDNGNTLGYQLGYYAGYDVAYTKGVKDGAGHGYNISDPTYKEATQFIKSDKTDSHSYTDDYTCFNFAADFKTNAFEAGYRCGFVYVEFKYGAHAMVCFDPVDREVMYIEPQDDKIVSLQVGGQYWGDTITYIAVIW